MDLKIFTAGFSEQEFNDFQNKHLIYKYHVIENGSIYIFYKGTQDLGMKTIEIIEALDRMVKQSQIEIQTYSIEIECFKDDIKKLNESKEGKFPNQDDWKNIEKAIKDKELRIKMAQDSINNNNQKVNLILSHSQSVLKGESR